ncbi:MAG: hypothetical protein LBU27_06900 [Candidatus Peribacteria bacterium]|jgi:hypothetical protein|nr:hypothetical protein [Candidatus Peribacteria bacterium]
MEDKKTKRSISDYEELFALTFVPHRSSEERKNERISNFLTLSKTIKQIIIDYLEEYKNETITDTMRKFPNDVQAIQFRNGSLSAIASLVQSIKQSMKTEYFDAVE